MIAIRILSRQIVLSRQTAGNMILSLRIILIAIHACIAIRILSRRTAGIARGLVDLFGRKPNTAIIPSPGISPPHGPKVSTLDTAMVVQHTDTLILTVDNGATTTLSNTLFNMNHAQQCSVKISLACRACSRGMSIKATHGGYKSYYIKDVTGALHKCTTKAFYVPTKEKK